MIVFPKFIFNQSKNKFEFIENFRILLIRFTKKKTEKFSEIKRKGSDETTFNCAVSSGMWLLQDGYTDLTETGKFGNHL